MTAQRTVEVVPLVRPPAATVVVPGSRSISNRALVCAALATGTSRISGLLRSDDTEAMLECLGALGIAWRATDPTTVEVDGCGGRVPPGPASLHTRLSGTTSRFVTALCALGTGEYRIDAAPPMRRRPMRVLIDALGALGVEVESTNGSLPLVIRTDGLHGGSVAVSGDVSSQFLSALLLVGPCAAAPLHVEVIGELKSLPYVRMTQAVMAAFGADSETVGGYRATTFAVEPDVSSACYFWAAAAITGGSIRVEGIGGASLQGDVGFLEVLEAMGCTVERGPDATTVAGPERLRGVDVDLADLSDQAPTFAAVAAFAAGRSRVSGIGFIRRKESDRIAAVIEGLGRLGVVAAEEPDGFSVDGAGPAGPPHGGVVRTFDDHRIAMSFALVGLRTAGVVIEDPDCVAKTYPDFFEDLESLAARQ